MILGQDERFESQPRRTAYHRVIGNTPHLHQTTPPLTPDSRSPLPLDVRPYYLLHIPVFARRTDYCTQTRQLLAGEAGLPSSRAFTVPQAAQTPAPATVRKLGPPVSRAAALEGPSPMPSWGVNLRDASAGETLEVHTTYVSFLRGWETGDVSAKHG